MPLDMIPDTSSVASGSEEQEQHPVSRFSDTDKEDIAQKENSAVWYTRLILLLILCASAIGVSLWVYLYLTHEEQDDFEMYVSLAGYYIATVCIYVTRSISKSICCMK